MPEDARNRNRPGSALPSLGLLNIRFDENYPPAAPPSRFRRSLLHTSPCLSCPLLPCLASIALTSAPTPFNLPPEVKREAARNHVSWRARKGMLAGSGDELQITQCIRVRFPFTTLRSPQLQWLLIPASCRRRIPALSALARYYADKCTVRPSAPLTAITDAQLSLPLAHDHLHARPLPNDDRR